MASTKLLFVEGVTDNLLSNLASRDVALWLGGIPKDGPSQALLAKFLGLPWRLIVTEIYDPALVEAVEASSGLGDLMVRRRGFVQIVDSDPARIQLPERCLPIYLLNGRKGNDSGSDFEKRLRRLTMLEELRRSEVREVLVISGDDLAVPPDLNELWSSGFRCFITFNSDAAGATDAVAQWVDRVEGIAAATFARLPTRQLIEDVLRRYAATYPEDRHVLRMRDSSGKFNRVDVTEADEPERPILELFSLVEERDILPLTASELSENDFISFFRNSESSWRPYAAGLPWVRDADSVKKLRNILKRLDSIGPDETCVAYISCEPGAGGTTLARTLAWECARDGYPTMVAKSAPFAPDALSVGNFLNRVHAQSEQTLSTARASESGGHRQAADEGDKSESRRYETPWVIVFDNLHWQHRDSELARFRNELHKQGRPVCIVVVTSPILGLSFFNTSVFRRISELNHTLTLDEARGLGRHLNKFLRVYGKERSESQWDRFYETHTVRYLEGISAFWVTLSFWIQGQYDLSESIQQWMYRSFKEHASDRVVQDAILEISALSSERVPLPDALLPESRGRWPVSHLLEDCRANLSAIGLVRVSNSEGKYWALVHDILGRLLINAIFYDFPMRESLGFGKARDAEHLRFLILRQVAKKPVLGERAYRSLGEDFATAIFKIDPDHGHGSFASIWREVLATLDSMPRPLRDTSRVFRHHTAISRRRIAKLDERFYGITTGDKGDLLNKAIEDINYALAYVDYTPGSESNLNLLNSLANAYLDLAEFESLRGAERTRVLELRQLANDATRKAYAESPTNSFVIETYVKNLLESVPSTSEMAVANCIEALGILYSALTSDEVAYRRSQLGTLADKALGLLLGQKATHAEGSSRYARAQVEIARLGYMALRMREAAKEAGPKDRGRSGGELRVVGDGLEV